eukprot:scaffold88162_cov34-Prasinocladus_malaysianus.AAC.1
MPYSQDASSRCTRICFLNSTPRAPSIHVKSAVQYRGGVFTVNQCLHALGCATDDDRLHSGI